jgi:hypothetical protein
MKPSNIKSLKQQLQQHISQVQLNDRQFDELEKLMGQGADHVETTSDRQLWGSLAIAGMLFVAALTTFMVSQFSSSEDILQN